MNKKKLIITCALLLMNTISWGQNNLRFDDYLFADDHLFAFPIFRVGVVKLLNVDCGYTDQDIENRILSFTDLGVCYKDYPKWQAVSKESSEEIKALYAHNNELYMSSKQGVFKTQDNGETWTKINNGLPTDAVVLTLHAHGGSLFAGTYEHGIFRTDNGGNNWVREDNVSTEEPVIGLYSYKGNLYVSCGRSYRTYRSKLYVRSLNKTDDGKSWHRISDDLDNETVTSLQVHEDILYAGTDTGMFKSADDGKHWVKVIEEARVIFLYAHKNYLYAMIEGKGLLKTNDAGKTWTQINKNSRLAQTSGLFSDDNYLYAVTADGGIFKTNDAGEDWTIVNDDGFKGKNNEVFYPVQPIQFHKNFIYVVTDRGVYKNNLVLGLYKFSPPDRFPAGHLYHGTHGGIFQINRKGIGWIKMNHGFTVDYHGGSSGLWIKSLKSHNGDLYAATNHGIYRASSNGENWQQVNDTWKVNVLYSHYDGYLYAGSGLSGGIIRSKDGIFWDGFNYGLKSIAGYAPSIEDICAFGNYLYVASWNGIYRIRYSGWQWEKVESEIEINAIVLKVHNNYLYAGTRGKGIFKSNDGIVWYEVNSEELKGKEIMALYSLNDFLYARTNEGVVLGTKDGGRNWARIENLVKNDNVLELYLHNGYLYAGTLLQGIFRTKEKVSSSKAYEEL